MKMEPGFDSVPGGLINTNIYNKHELKVGMPFVTQAMN